ncbi:MAG TPA: NAD(P)H-binding protein [Alphaproteobacteria bacterium]|nr:NAD(P)H-binding protein [Alphaproteobacteria bacterium]
MTSTILIIGGTGAVGAKCARILSERSDLRVIIGSRQPDKAAHLSAQLGVEVWPIDLDVPETWRRIGAGVDLVIVCADQQDVGFARYALSNAIHYVDITAGDSFFRSVELLKPEELPATALLSVGLAPGITNLLSADAASRLDTVDSIEIGLLLGLGDMHGRAATDWTVRRIFSVRQRPSAIIDFGPAWGRRRAFWMDLADQHVLGRTMGIDAVTRVAFDSRLLTATIFMLGDLFFRSSIMMRLTSRLSSIISFGSDACVAVATARGKLRDRPGVSVSRFSGRRAGAVTAHVAAHAAISILEGPERRGVFHLQQFMSATSTFDELELAGVGTVSREWRDA